ncbi:unnamed protein product [Phytomonas sp. EM1]|nr:unnamed protein product [Phytomonas sp. EM1]|eukprot:CCW62748.1 unnamed protein product [Phytomonas sp. isolate EM1]
MRLVSHEFASKGHEYCNKMKRFVSISPSNTTKEFTGNKLRVSDQGGIPLNAKANHASFSDSPHEHPGVMDVKVGGAESALRPEAKLSDPHSQKIQVRWVVPRFVFHDRGLDELIRIWDVGGNAQFFFYVNTDLAEELSLDGRESFELIAYPPASKVTQGLRTKISAVFLNRFGHVRCPSSLRSSVQWKSNGFGDGDVGALSHNTEGKAGRNEDCALFPTLFLNKISEAMPWQKQFIFHKLKKGLDPFCLFNRCPIVSEEERVAKLINAACSKNFNILEYAKAASLESIPRVFLDECAAKEFKKFTQIKNHRYAKILANLKDCLPPAANSSVSNGKRVLDKENCGAVHNTFCLPKMHCYFPLVIHAGECLHRSCCLSDIFVFEFSEDVMPLERIAAELQHILGVECKTRDYSRAKLLKAAEKYLIFRDSMCSERLVSVVRSYVQLLLPFRLVLSWPMTDPAERLPRFGICLSYEMFSGRLFKSLPAVSSAKSAFKRIWIGNTRMDMGPHSEKMDPTTMEHQLRLLIWFLRESGWILIHQEDHRLWDTAHLSRQSECVEEAEAVKEETVLQRVLRLTSSDKNTVAVHGIKNRGHYSPLEMKENEMPRRTLLASQDAVYTSLELWQACIVPPSAGLYLWRGLVVSTSRGRFGIVVDFKPIPSQQLERTFTPPHSLKSFFRWYRSQCQRSAQSGDIEFVYPRWKPALPPYLEKMEMRLWPVVYFPTENTFELVLPTMKRLYFIRYPTVCFVSAAQESKLFRKHASLHVHTKAGPFTPCKSVNMERMSARWSSMRARSCEEVSQGVWPEAHIRNIPWRLEHSQADQRIITSQLSLQLTICESAASLYMEAVLNFGRQRSSRRTPFRLESVEHKHLLRQWDELHQKRIAEAQTGDEMGSISRTLVPLRSRRLIASTSFLRRPRALRSLVAVLPCLSNALLV